MTIRLQPYPTYRSSGLSWIDHVPDHWQVKRNGQLFAQRKETGFAELPILEVSLRTGVRVRRFDATARKQVMSDRSKYKRAAKGDLAYNMMRMWQGAVGVAPEDGLVSPAYIVASPFQGIHPKYFSELFRTSAYMSEVDGYSHGIVKDRNRLYWEDFKQIFSVCPPPDEQEKIVRYIAYFDRRFERFVSAKNKVARLLLEQRCSIAEKALTRGLDGQVRTRPSGVYWLGNIPEGWSLRRFKSITKINNGQVDPRFATYRNLMLVAPNHVESGTGRLLGLETAADQGAVSGKYFVQQGQVVYSKIRPNLRKAVIAPVDCLCSADMYAITPDESELSSDYLLMLMLSTAFTKFATDYSQRVAMPKVNREALGECWLWYPDLTTQADIVRFIQAQSESIDEAIEQIRRQVILMLEYRTCLVADLVTGKLDVRKAAAKLPDEADESDDVSPADVIIEEAEAADLDMGDLVEESG